MRDSLRQFHTRVTLLWQQGSLRRLAKLGGFIAIAFVLIAGTNLIFGSQGDARATSGGSSGVERFQDLANLPFEYQFIGQGRITGGSDDKWMVGDLPIQVGERTQLKNELHPGDFVSLSGRILDDKAWLADRIELAQAGESFFTFNGSLEWVRGIVWRVGGHTLLTDRQTRLGSSLTVNEFLLTTFTVLENGEWLALEIKAFDRFPLEPTPIPTLNKAQRKIEFTGLVEAIGTDVWTIAGKTLQIVRKTTIDGSVELGDTVKVHAAANPDGSLIARQIELIGEKVSNSPVIDNENVVNFDNKEDGDHKGGEDEDDGGKDEGDGGGEDEEGD